MNEKDFCKLNIDLVFRSSDFTKLLYNFHNLNEKLIFESIFWEKVFLCWIETILEEKNSKFPQFIFQKKVFSLSLEIINNQEITSINKRWMQKNIPTDVLSFPIISDIDCIKDLEFIELGDLFISLEMALKQSLEYKHSIHKEMLLLASHGFLHLLGWEHNDAVELENMLNFQEYLISRLDKTIYAK